MHVTYIISYASVLGGTGIRAGRETTRANTTGVPLFCAQCLNLKPQTPLRFLCAVNLRHKLRKESVRFVLHGLRL